MSCLKINGGIRLNGDIKVQGAKNAVLPILAATLINRGECVIHNCPRLKDVEAALEILRAVGCRTDFSGNTVTVNSSCADIFSVPEELMLKMRSSVIFCGGLLSAFRRAEISRPGGCELGARPIDLHLKAFKSLGVETNESHGRIVCNGENMKSAKIYLDFPSVGATENIMLAAAGLLGVTTITNAAKEPEITDLQDFLNSMGAKISGAGTDEITIQGADSFHDTEYTVMPDRIAAATYMSAAAAAGGKILLRGIVFPHVEAVASVFSDCGCEIRQIDTDMVFCVPQRLSMPDRITTSPYPGFPTDAQAVVMASLCKASGTGIITENIFENRFKHVPDLVRMGADISVHGRCAVLRGADSLSGADVTSPDLRGGAALVCGALSAKGESRVFGVHHIDRGYESIENDLSALGADIRRQKSEQTKDKTAEKGTRQKK